MIGAVYLGNSGNTNSVADLKTPEAVEEGRHALPLQLMHVLICAPHFCAVVGVDATDQKGGAGVLAAMSLHTGSSHRGYI